MARNKRIARCAVAALCLSATGTVLAQANPFYVGIAQAFTHESNVFRAQSGLPESADTYSTTSLLAGIDQPFGRQRFFADAVARYNGYQDNTQLNSTGYSLDAGLDWATVEKLSGRLSYTLNENLARYGADQGPALITKNLERNQEFLARGQYGLASILALEGIFTHRQLEYSAAEFTFQDFKQDAASLGLLYRPGGLLTFGIAARRTNGKYPYAVRTSAGVFQQDDFKRNDIDLTAIWVPTGLSTVSVRLSNTKETHESVTSRNFSGATGAVRWDYRATGKLTFATELARDSGAESSFNRLVQDNTGSLGNNSLRSTSLAFRGLYEVTPKIQVEANLRYVARDLVDTLNLSAGAASTQVGSDKFAESNLGVKYAFSRSLLMGCALGYEKRGSSSIRSYPYTANRASCSAQFKTQ